MGTAISKLIVHLSDLSAGLVPGPPNGVNLSMLLVRLQVPVIVSMGPIDVCVLPAGQPLPEDVTLPSTGLGGSSSSLAAVRAVMEGIKLRRERNFILGV